VSRLSRGCRCGRLGRRRKGNAVHVSSLLKVEAFLDEYVTEPASSEPKSVLDIGSAAYKGHPTYRDPAEKRGLLYVGLDMQPGENVDIVSANPVVYSEVGTESHDFIVSGQTFEHNPFFWVSFCEMARILKQGGRMIVVAPSAGKVHRFPFDCWRYYPDAWMALCAISGLQREEIIFEPDEHRGKVDGVMWRDSVVVARKRTFASEEESHRFYARIASFTAPFVAESFELVVSEPNLGPVFARYAETVRSRAAAKPTTPARAAGAAAARGARRDWRTLWASLRTPSSWRL
jgi:SAM-dependent methyltransferase